MNASSITQLRACGAVVGTETHVELNQLQNVIGDLRERSVALRGYL